MQIIPAIDILDSQVARLIQGDYNQKIVYSDNPIEVAAGFAKAGARRLHLVDLSGARDAQSQAVALFAAIKKATGCVIEAGGGIRSLAEVENIFSAGLDPATDKIMIGSLPFKNPAEFAAICRKYPGSILLTVDVWGREIKISGWKEKTGSNLFAFLREMHESFGIGEFLVTQIQKDGMLSGPDTGLYQDILAKVSGIKLIASGGMSEMADFDQLAKMSGISGAILGRAFYEKKISLADITAFVARH